MKPYSECGCTWEKFSCCGNPEDTVVNEESEIIELGGQWEMCTCVKTLRAARVFVSYL